MPTVVDTEAVAMEIASDLDALRLYDAEMQEEPWKRSNQAYIDLVEERFNSLLNKITEVYFEDAPTRLRDTILAMPCVASIWNAWVEREQIELPEAHGGGSGVRPWLDVVHVNG